VFLLIIYHLTATDFAPKQFYDKIKGMAQETKSFLRVLKHQLKGPLTVTKGYLSFWETGTYDKFPPEKQRGFILKALEGAKRVDEMLNDAFLALRIDAKEIESIIDPFSMQELIDPIIAATQKKYESKNLAFTITYPAAPVAMNADKGNYGLIIQKALDNAFKFTETGSVTMAIAQNAEKTSITIIDTGIGFSDEEKAIMFNRLFHGSLSMAIMKELSTFLGGDISVYSEGKGKGSTITITLCNNITKV
jgi:signal transduction histidine kinase